MRRSILLIFLFLISHTISSAQVSDITFIGSAVLKGGKAFNYKLRVNDSAGILRGYSVMDITGPNETRTAVRGSLARDKKSLSFRETKIIATKSKSDPANFCYIRSTLKIVKTKKSMLLKGTFKGYKQDGKTECASGKLVLVCGQEVLNKLMKIAREDSAMKPKKDTLVKAPANYQVVYEKDIPASKIKALMPGMMTEVVCSSPIVTVEVWDAKTIDGDKVTLTQDNKPVLENFTLSGKRKTVRIDMGKKSEVMLRLLALNEGTEPMNTARLRVVSGGEEHYIDATTTVQQSVRIVLKKKS